MRGTISYIEKGSFQGKEGLVYFHNVIVDGVKYTCYNKSISEKKVNDEIEFEKVDKGEGKTPQMKLAGEQQGFKKEWKAQDPDGMYRCNAMTNAVSFFKGDNIEGLITIYNAIYKAMKGDVVNTATNVVPAVTNTQTVAQTSQRTEQNTSAPKATSPQKNTIMHKAQAYKSDVGNLIKEALKYDMHIEDLSKAEASLIITYFNDKEAKGDEPF